MKLESQYARPVLENAVSRDGKTMAFRVTQELGRAIDHASDRAGYRYVSEWIRACLIREIERVIRES